MSSEIIFLDLNCKILKIQSHNSLKLNSPNLNLIERLWKFMIIKILNSKFYEKFPVLKKI